MASCQTLHWLIMHPRSIDPDATLILTLALFQQVDDEIHPSEIAICKRPDGSDWCLGEGNFGKVR